MAKKKKDDDRIGIVVDSRLHIPVKVVDAPKIIKKLTRYQFEDGICKTCEFRPLRPSAECNVCETGGLVGVTVLGKLDTVDGKKVVSIPYGEMHRFPKLTGLPLDRVRFINKTTRVPYDYDVEFTGSLRPYQEKPVADLMDELCGLLKAPPRSGKTVCGTYVACAHGYKTVIMADQKDFLDGFYETIESMTNLPQLEEEHGKKLYGFPKKLEDFENFQIILITYQSLLEKSKVAKKRLKLLNKHFGTIVVDEIHAAGAPTYTKILASLKMKYRYGLTATPKRKDSLHYRVESTFGPVVAEAFVDEMVPKITIHKTSKHVHSKQKFAGKAGWTYLNKFLANHKDRNDKIFEWIIKDLDAGRSLAIPIMFTDQAHKLVRRINEHYCEEVAAVFLGGAREAKRRKPIVDAAREGKIRCIVGMRKLMQRGINIPKWDTLYYIMPMNNEPNWKQESCRILTPMEGKKTPVIRMFIDPNFDKSMGFARSVLKMCWKFGYEKAKRTPAKLEKYFGVTDRDDVLGDGLPDYFTPNDEQSRKSLFG